MSKYSNEQERERKKITEGIWRILILILLITILSSGLASAETIISACTNINVSGSYALNQNISSTATCLNITVSDVLLDCNGYTITYDTSGTTTRMGIDASNGTNPRTNLTIKDCVLIKPTNIQTAGYGIRLTRYSNSNLINNTIYTNGSTNNYGIFLTTNSQNNLIENNTIYASGTSSGNYGIYIYNGSSGNTAKHNLIYTNGTSANYGLHLLGTASTGTNNNLIQENIIYTNGNSTTNYGIYIFTNGNNNTITGNNINTNGSGTSHGIYISGVTSGSNNNQITFNNVSTAGSGASNYGILIYRNASSNNVTGNKVRTNGTTTNYGIYGVGNTGLAVDNNIIDSNDVQAQGLTAGDNYGIYFASNADNNTITNNTVRTNGPGVRNYGIYIAGSATLTANNNLVQSNNVSTNGTTTNYGIYLVNNANYNNITNNYIVTSGNTTGHGIYISGATYESRENEISYNRIYANGTDGTTSNNAGIYLYRNATQNRVIRNNISASGTASSYGIVLSGTTALPVNSNILDANKISTSGRTAGNNYGIYLTTYTSMNNITNNDISTTGTTANYGIYIAGAAGLQADNNLISANRIQTLGTTTNNYGIAVSTNTNSNIIEENNISTMGTSGNIGIYLAGSTTLSSNNNIISDNNIQTNGSLNNNYGIYVLTNANNNIVSENSIRTYGTGTDHGVYLSGASFTSNGNQILYNNISTASSGASNYGIHLYRNISFSNVTGNTIQTSGTGSDYGIYLLGTAALRVESNIIGYNSLSVISADTIRIDIGSRNNTLMSNSILARNTSYFDINILSAENIGTELINQSFQRYNFAGTGESISVIDANYGEIAYSQKVTGNGTSLTDSIRISQNQVYVNSSQAGLNKSAVISLFNVNYDYPVVLRDGEVCTDCSILSNSGGIISFSVPHFSSYSISENSRLEIFDDSQLNMSYQHIEIFANYTNRTNEAPITGSGEICTISFNDSDYNNMSYNSASGLYEFGRMFEANGTFPYNVTCNGTAQGFEAIQLSGTTEYHSSFYGPRYNNAKYYVSTRANITNAAPEILNISCNNGYDITLNAGATQEVLCTLKLRDYNGGDTITSANATFYYYLNKSSDPDDNSAHYTNTSCSQQSVDGFNTTWSCAFNIWYYANNGTWRINATVKDDHDFSTNAAYNSSILPMYAINVTSLIDYGSLAVQDTSSIQTANITNLGNMRINVSIYAFGGDNETTGAGVAMICEQRNISIQNERYSLDSSATYQSMTPVTGSATKITGLNMPKQTSPAALQTNSTYWMLHVNITNNPSGVCNGTIIFSAEP